MQLFDLNDDALLDIGALLLLKDLSRLSRTCHRLHDLICIHLLLKDANTGLLRLGLKERDGISMTASTCAFST